MDNEKDDENQNQECCGGGASCGCGGTSMRRSKGKILIFAVVMLAAVGVGAYSFWTKPSAPACAASSCGPDSTCCGSSGK